MDLEEHWVRYQEILKLLKKYLPNESVEILDVGCGPGQLGKLILKEGYKNVWGIDISDESLRLAEQKGLKTKKVNLEENFPFGENIFDCVIASEVIEHIYDTEHFLDEIKRILKPSGILIITTPNVASLGRRLMLLVGKNPILEYKLSGGAGHIRYFTFRDMAHLLREKGFILVEQKSDTINILPSGKFSQRWLAKIYPTLGRCILSVARK